MLLGVVAASPDPRLLEQSSQLPLPSSDPSSWCLTRKVTYVSVVSLLESVNCFFPSVALILWLPWSYASNPPPDVQSQPLGTLYFPPNV